MGAYEDGYRAGSLGDIGACLADNSQQAEYDRGYADARAGRSSNPNPPISVPNPADPPYYNPSDPNAEPPPTMGPADGSTGGGPPESPEWPEYDLPPEPYEPEVVD
jgi:hypothetical protein